MYVHIYFSINDLSGNLGYKSNPNQVNILSDVAYDIDRPFNNLSIINFGCNSGHEYNVN